MNNIVEEIKVALHGIWQRRWMALAIAWGVSLLGWLVISMIPNKYESKASVFVQAQSLLSGKIGISANERKASLDSITNTLTSAESLEKVVRGTALIRNGSSAKEVAATAEGLRSKITIAAKQDNLFEITASAGYGGMSNNDNAKLSKAIVQKLLDLFVDGNLSSNRVETTQTLRFLDAEIGQRGEQLQIAENRRAEFESKNIGLLPGAGSATMRMESARMELGQLESSIMAAQGGLAAVNAQLAGTPSSISTPGAISGPGAAAGRVAAIESQMGEAQARGLTDLHPDMIAMRTQLSLARRSLAAEGGPRSTGGSVSSNPVYSSLRASLAEKQAAVSALSMRRAQLQAEMGQYQVNRTAEPAVEAEQQRLNRDYDVLKTQYDKLLADREEIRLRGSLQTDTDSIKFDVIEPPTAPSSPAAPNRPMLLTLVLLVGIIAGAGAAFGLAQIKGSYATAGQLERSSGLPVIGTISQVLSPGQRSDYRKKLKYFAGGSAALLGVFLLLVVVEFVQRGSVV